MSNTQESLFTSVKEVPMKTETTLNLNNMEKESVVSASQYSSQGSQGQDSVFKRILEAKKHL